jgi:hypothetical protein
MVDTGESVIRPQTTDPVSTRPRPGWTVWLWLAVGILHTAYRTLRTADVRMAQRQKS